jgi:predicted DNA-binding protein
MLSDVATNTTDGKKKLQVWVSTEVYARLQDSARRDHRTVSSYLRALVYKHMGYD